jgi:transcriptional regulator with XRE-family HTH domain
MTNSAGSLIRDAREAAGLSQRELALKAGTSQPTISAYEQGRKVPTAETLIRLVEATGHELVATAAQSTREWLRQTGHTIGDPTEVMPSAARRVDAGEDALFVLRELLDALYLWEEVRGESAVARVISVAPQATSDRRFDALVGGLAEHIAVTRSLERPSWVCAPERFLDAWWFPHPRRGFDAIALRDAPAAFRRRGVMIHPSMLERR